LPRIGEKLDVHEIDRGRMRQAMEKVATYVGKEAGTTGVEA